MRPIAVINASKLANSDIDQPSKLHAAGYLVIFVNDGPAIMLHQAAPGRRERIATAIMAGLAANEAFAHATEVETARLALVMADVFIEELNK